MKEFEDTAYQSNVKPDLNISRKVEQSQSQFNVAFGLYKLATWDPTPIDYDGYLEVGI